MPIGKRGSRYRPFPGAHFGYANKGQLTTALAGSNNDLTFRANTQGVVGNSTTIAYVVAGASTPLSVSVTGSAITVNVATNGSSVATSTAAQVRDAVNAHAQAGQLVSAENATGNDGTGVVTALAATPLAGGTDWVIGTGSTTLRRVKQGGV
jgi:hypothetical protein